MGGEGLAGLYEAPSSPTYLAGTHLGCHGTRSAWMTAGCVPNLTPLFSCIYILLEFMEFINIYSKYNI